MTRVLLSFYMVNWNEALQLSRMLHQQTHGWLRMDVLQINMECIHKFAHLLCLYTGGDRHYISLSPSKTLGSFQTFSQKQLSTR